MFVQKRDEAKTVDETIGKVKRDLAWSQTPFKMKIKDFPEFPALSFRDSKLFKMMEGPFSS